MKTFPVLYRHPSLGPRSVAPLIVLALLASSCSEEDAPPGSAAPLTVNGPGPAYPLEAWSEPPPLRRPVSLGDRQLGERALQLLGRTAGGGGSGPCRNCHSLGRPTLTRWSKLTQEFSAACLQDSDLDNRAEVAAMLDCFRERSGKPVTPFAPEDFGIYAAAAQLPWFTFVFRQAPGVGDWRSAHAGFVSRVAMPRAGQPWTQEEFDIVAEWFARRLPALLELVPEDSGEECSPGMDPRLGDHVLRMATEGWRARNEELPLLMFGCGAGETGSECLSDFPLAEELRDSDGWEPLLGSQIRVLWDNSASPTTYWSRCSADGRYIGSGLRDFDDSDAAGQILDLETEAVISANFSYDATFFPDNSGFLVQQGGGYSGQPKGEPTDGSVNAGDEALVCEQSVLAAEPERLTGEENECTLLSGRIGLYQQLARSPDGGDYWAIHGSYESDNGGFEPVLLNPSAAFEATSSVTLTPLINQGNGFEAGAPVRIETPRQGDPMLSASGQLLAMRTKGREFTVDSDGFELVAAEQSGYAIYRVLAERSGSGWSATLEDVGRICLQGGKPTFSFDERWMVFHHYVVEEDAAELGYAGAADGDFAEYLELGASNLYLADLSNGQVQRFTNMPPGQFALFPHFRSDGWVYFVVRTLEGEEFFAASDAALVLEAQQ